MPQVIPEMIDSVKAIHCVPTRIKDKIKQIMMQFDKKSSGDIFLEAARSKNYQHLT